MSLDLYQVIILTMDLVNGRYDRARIVPAGPLLAIYTSLFGPGSREAADAYLADLRGGAAVMGGDSDYWPWDTGFGPKGSGDKRTKGSLHGVIYRIVRDGHWLTLIAEGTKPHDDDDVRLAQSSIAIYPPQFALVLETLEASTQAPALFGVHATLFGYEEQFAALTVWDADGRHSVAVPGALATS